MVSSNIDDIPKFPVKDIPDRAGNMFLRDIHLLFIPRLSLFVQPHPPFLSPTLIYSISSPSFLRPRLQGISHILSAILLSGSLCRTGLSVPPQSLLFISTIFNCLTILAELSSHEARLRAHGLVVHRLEEVCILGIFRFWKERSPLSLYELHRLQPPASAMERQEGATLRFHR